MNHTERTAYLQRLAEQLNATGEQRPQSSKPMQDAIKRAMDKTHDAGKPAPRARDDGKVFKGK